MPKNINLPTERVQQLERLAEKWKMSVADVVGELIHQQIEKGELERGVPGFRIFKNGKEVHIGTDEWDKQVSAQSASNIANSIRSLITPSKENPMLPLPDGFGLARRGTSLKLKDTETGAEKTLAPSIAKDVAEMLERVAKS
ncbi:hypothetical protein BWR17_03990 [Phaeobacter inhibens]|uniref:hypothetical protein n=1 Tax=Phaeobacter inhibens TaxID=221822 RepID=UPI000971839C|nr:hypothetical protein [Phaeobacter inhibens]APX15091.1 hypothetical protein BWR17_03990 [Phaeobacter inhibens]